MSPKDPGWHYWEVAEPSEGRALQRDCGTPAPLSSFLLLPGHEVNSLLHHVLPTIVVWHMYQGPKTMGPPKHKSETLKL
jgi:hypothetical protein